MTAIARRSPGRRSRRRVVALFRRTQAHQPVVSARAPWLLGPLAGVIVAVLFTGVGGLLAGACVAALVIVVGRRAGRRVDPRLARRQRARAPEFVDLLTAALAAGAHPAAALAVAAQACGPPLGPDAARAAGSLLLGGDPSTVWAELAVAVPALAPAARACARTDVTGARLTDVLTAVADELRDELRADAVSAARAVGVRAVAPLGLCFLPGFVAMAVVPLIASLLGDGPLGSVLGG